MSQTIRSLSLALLLALGTASPALACGSLTPADEISFAVQDRVAMSYLPRGPVQVLAIDEVAGTACAEVRQIGEGNDLRYTVELALTDGVWHVTSIGPVQRVPHSG